MAVNRPPTLQNGTRVIDRYTVLSVIGYGGLGTVYLVQDDSIPQHPRLALKETFDLSEGAKRQFEQEALWMERLDHPNIPRVRHYFPWHDRLYLVMDYVAGENLEHKLMRNQQRPLAETDVLRWTYPICDALAYLHSQQPPIVHRDVKPANIIVTPQGRSALVDLGIAKELNDIATMTATFIRKAGTEGYAPPEQYAGRGTTGPHSDIYSLGATLYHLLTGQLPISAVERATLDNQLTAPRRLNPVLSPQIEAIMLRALAIRPSDRFASMRDMEAAIGEALQRASTPPFTGPTGTGALVATPISPTSGGAPQRPLTGPPPIFTPQVNPPSAPYPPPRVNLENAPTLLRSGPPSNGKKRPAIERPRGMRSGGRLRPLPQTSTGTADDAPTRRTQATPTPRRGFPWQWMVGILAVLLLLFGLYLGTRDFWSALMATH
jgi:eukaryotic-like serine/threonine-protein kinase